jgi:hypothetical protein
MPKVFEGLLWFWRRLLIGVQSNDPNRRRNLVRIWAVDFGNRRRKVFELAGILNLVEFLEGEVVKHKLGGSEIFIFTDNSTSEAAFWKGTS